MKFSLELAAVLVLFVVSSSAYAGFERITVYWGRENTSGQCVQEAGSSLCYEFRTSISACVAALTPPFISVAKANIGVRPELDPAGNHACTANDPFGSPCNNDSNECRTAFSAKPVLTCPPHSTFNGTVCNADPDFIEANATASGGDNNGKKCPSCGNPVNPANGNKVEEQLIYRGLNGFELSFTFNTFDDFTPRFGRHWRDSYDRRVLVDGVNVTVYRPDGRALKFTPSGGAWVGDVDTDERLVELQNPPGTRTGWELSVANGDELETYDAAGKLLAIQSRSGLTQTLTYSDGTGGANGGFVLDANANPTTRLLPAGLLIRVSDHFGRTISFGYDPARVIKVTNPAGGVYRFGYSMVERLQTITYPDNSVLTYVYNESANTGGAYLPRALTGIVDENGARFATFKYDSQERSVSTERAGTTLRYALSYGSGSTTVTDPLNTVRTYAFSTVNGAFKNTSVTGPVCPECG